MSAKILIPKLHENDHTFPDPRNASNEGLLAWGGDLNPNRLLRAYERGIFPWFNEGDPILWWSPNPRLILYPERIKISKSLAKSLKHFEIRYDTCFEEVMRQCWQTRLQKGEKSWINEPLIQAFCTLHVRNFAHSVETFFEGKLVGGLYGLFLGGMFCGESMFSIKTDASKAALVGLCRKMCCLSGDFIDCQLPTEHLKSLGAEEIDREHFLALIDQALEKEAFQEWSVTH